MMLSPKTTAALHAKRNELGFLDGLENFGTPVLITYLPLLLLALVLSGNLEPIYLSAVIFSLAATTLGIFLVSLIFSLMALMVASSLGGKAQFERLYYMTSLAAAPTFVFTVVINIAVLLIKSIMRSVSFSFAAIDALQMMGDLVAISVTIYGFYLLTISINALYMFGRAKSVATWLIPAIIIFAAGAAFLLTDIFGVFKFLVKTLL